MFNKFSNEAEGGCGNHHLQILLGSLRDSRMALLGRNREAESDILTQVLGEEQTSLANTSSSIYETPDSVLLL